VLLCIDIGNTQTALALYPSPADGEAAAGVAGWPEARWTARVHTERRAAADELALTVRGMLGPLLAEVDGVAALSTVPALLRELRGMLERHFAGVEHVLVEPGVRTGVPLLVDNPKEVGADRVVQALAASLKIELLYLPSYSPNLNLIERLWKFLRKKALNRWLKTFEEMQAAVAGVLDRLGLGWTALHQRNKRLILASISGFGQTGPYAPRAGYDAILQAMGGLMSVTGHIDGQPGEGPMKVRPCASTISANCAFSLRKP